MIDLNVKINKAPHSWGFLFVYVIFVRFGEGDNYEKIIINCITAIIDCWV